MQRLKAGGIFKNYKSLAMVAAMLLSVPANGFAAEPVVVGDALIYDGECVPSPKQVSVFDLLSGSLFGLQCRGIGIMEKLSWHGRG